MIGALSILSKQPCLIAVVNDGDEPDLIMVEPLKFVSAASCYAKGCNQQRFLRKSVHATPSTQEDKQDHVR